MADINTIFGYETRVIATPGKVRRILTSIPGSDIRLCSNLGKAGYTLYVFSNIRGLTRDATAAIFESLQAMQSNAPETWTYGSDTFYNVIMTGVRPIGDRMYTYSGSSGTWLCQVMATLEEL